MALLKLFRLPNLLIIFLTMLGAQYIVYGVSDLFYFPAPFWLLLFATVLICAAGNVFNDYLDQATDQVNRPETVIVGKRINPRVAIYTYHALNLTALLVDLFIVWKIDGALWIPILHLACVALLWHYSVFFKCTAWLGNLTVSVLCAVVPMQIWWLAGIMDIPAPHIIPTKLVLFCIFSFCFTYWRELVKDLEDRPGDEAMECNTFPVQNEVLALQLALGIGVMILLSLIGLVYWHLEGLPRILAAPLLGGTSAMALLMLKKQNYKIASLMIKLAMLAGICILVL
jgi:4-hydroxybenzoate polyprenyltransferase